MSFGDAGAQHSGDASPLLIGPAGGPFGLSSAPLPGRQGGFRVQVASSVVDGVTARRTGKTSRTIARAARRQPLACGAQQRERSDWSAARKWMARSVWTPTVGPGSSDDHR